MQVGVLMQHVFQVTPAFTDLVHSTPSCIGFQPVLDGREREPVVKQVVQRARRRASLRRAAGCDKGAQGQLRQGRAGWHGRGWEPAVQRARASASTRTTLSERRPSATGRSRRCGSLTFYGPNGACEVGLEASDGGNRGSQFGIVLTGSEAEQFV